MKIKTILPLAAGLLAAAVSHAIIIDTVFVGNPGNAGQSSANRNHSASGGDGFGAVPYSYHIGTYAVTNTQYTAFLNAVATTNGDPHGLYNANMGTSVHGGISRTGAGTAADPFVYSVRTASSGFNNGQSMGDMPVNFVSFWDAARFANWLTTGNTETGVYMLGDVTNPTNSTITRDATAWANGGVAIASENEWFKAAYYNPATSTYALYATGSDTAPAATVPNSTDANSANRSGSLSPASNTVTPVGAYTLAASAYGTFDQAGNVWEWNDTISGSSDHLRGLRGGSFASNDSDLQSSVRGGGSPSNGFNFVGFRVSSLAPIPEPSTYAAILGGLGLLIVLLRRKGRGTL